MNLTKPNPNMNTQTIFFKTLMIIFVVASLAGCEKVAASKEADKSSHGHSHD
jgi:predicted small lipoprotein YifL